MAQITYVGAADVKRFTKADFAKHDIEQDAVHFDADNNFTADVSDAAWEWLNSDASLEKGQFKLASEADAPEGADEAPGPDAPSEDADAVAPGGTPTSETGTDRAKAGGTTRGSTRGT